MPNALAYLMLMTWPLVCVALFIRLTPERAIIWSILGGYLLLPQRAEFDLPLVPDMTKISIPNICAFVLCVWFLKKPVSFWPSGWTMRLLLLAFFLGVVPTVLTNGDAIVFKLMGHTEPIVFSEAALPGLGLRDLLSIVINQFITVLPFFLARRWLSSETGLRELLYALVVGALIYSIPALIEIRLSPQMNIWFYGFFQHDFEQMMRGGGFRPLVFLPHALWLAFFVMSAAMAALALGREEAGPRRARFFAAALYLLILLVLCKSLASMLYAAALTPLLLIANARMQIRVALLFALIAVIYPVLRENGVIPLDAVLEQAEAISPERAHSLGFRFDNEEALLERAHDRRLFGWGGWGRNLVHDIHTGEILSIPDGEWIIVFGTFGWVGYISQMGLLGGPLVLLWWALRRAPAIQAPPYVSALALLLAITLIDMLLNAILTPYTWLMAGAILGCAERLSVSAPDLDPAPAAAKARRRTVMG
ncbi:hypothetical protein D6850_05165 [Roseovarius spongiae]|uniref:O-antigen ligase domain-containing protein n=1 Tax=Roseovarius spongiae TaxID=2320272 RepID=A0A3A8B4V9_9RHOB|nr:hypothetical protein [Roseovarius spongiae]RKF16921.1 hypothetical protein D6850_05165 [Roseovarius spongiae]